MRQLDVLPNGAHDPYKAPELTEGLLSVTAKSWLTKTFQGEGSYAGVPSLFLRLYGCNLACANCDTKYTWEPGTEGNRAYVTVEDAILAVKMRLPRAENGSAPHVVITGGEPMLQVNALVMLLDGLPEVKVTLETNGTIFDRLVADNLTLASISPKLTWLREHRDENYGIPESLEEWLTHSVDVQLKVVMEGEGDMETTLAFFKHVTRMYAIPPESCIGQLEWGRYGTNLKPFAQQFYDAGFCLGVQQHKVWGIP